MMMKESFSMWDPNPDARVRVGKEAAAKKFIAWASKNAPQIAREIKREVSKAANVTLSATVPETSRPWYETALDIAQQAIPTYIQYQAQRDIMKMQLDRARQGLPPLDTSQIAPTVRVQAEVPGVTNWIMPVALIGGGILAFTLLSGKKRRGR